MLCDTCTDVEKVLPHFVQKRLIKKIANNLEEIHVIPSTKKPQVCTEAS